MAIDSNRNVIFRKPQIKMRLIQIEMLHLGAATWTEQRSLGIVLVSRTPLL